LLFSGRNTPRHINNTHISLNCLTLSSEAPREEKEWKIHYCTSQKNRTARPCSFAIIRRRAPRQYVVGDFKKKSRVFKQNLLATLISPTSSASILGLINCTVPFIMERFDYIVYCTVQCRSINAGQPKKLATNGTEFSELRLYCRMGQMKRISVVFV
jgi:hypothetical protein